MDKPTPQHLDRQSLEARALDGLAALIELCGDDPTAPVLAGTPRRVVELVTGIARQSPIDLAAVLTSHPVPFARAPGRGPDPDAPQVDPAARLLVGPLPLHAICGQHLAPFTGTVHLAHDPGPEGYRPGRPPLGERPATWRPAAAALAVVVEHYAGALTSPAHLAANVVEALKVHLGGAGAAAAVEVTTGCSFPHVGVMVGVGRFHAVAGWGVYADLAYDSATTAHDPARALEFWKWVNLTTVPLADHRGEMYRRELIAPDPFGGPLAMVAGGPAGVLERTT